MGEVSVERGFLSKLLETKDMRLVHEQQIRASFFTGEYRRVFSLVEKVFRESGDVPTERVVLRDFPNFKFDSHRTDQGERVGTDETMLFWCGQVRMKSMHNRTADMVEKAADLLDEGKSEEAFNTLKSGISAIQSEVVIATGVDITKNAEERKAAYLERKKNQGIRGITFGISDLDYILKGLAEDTLTMLIATPGIGKTWFTVRFAAYAMLQNWKVVVFVTEMGTETMQDRFDAMLYSMMYRDFSYEKFRSGSLDMETERSYFEFLDEKTRLEPLILELATDVSGIAAVVDKEKPDLVCIDGVYLMEDEEKAEADWLRVSHITRGLKRLAKEKHIRIFGNSQADKSTSKKTGPELGNISFTQGVGQDSDTVLALFRDEVMRNDREMGVKVLKHREGILGKVYMQWDFSRMCFDGIYKEFETEEEAENADRETESLIIGKKGGMA